MLVGISLAVMLGLTLFSILTGNNFIGVTYGDDVDLGAILNGSTTTFVIEGDEFVFFLDPTMGLVIVLIVVVAGISLLSFQAVGSGLGGEGFRILAIGLLWGSLWAFLSALALPLINTIPTFGFVLYITLTIFYTIGVIGKMTGGGGEEV